MSEIIIRGGESLDMAQERITNELGHKIKFKYVNMCINVPKCIKCKKAGWEYLKNKCDV